MQEVAEREVAGESLWTDTFDARVRTRIMHLVARTVDVFKSFSLAELFANARRLIVEREGLVTLAGVTSAYDDFGSYFAECPDEMFPTVL